MTQRGNSPEPTFSSFPWDQLDALIDEGLNLKVISQRMEMNEEAIREACKKKMGVSFEDYLKIGEFDRPAAPAKEPDIDWKFIEDAAFTENSLEDIAIYCQCPTRTLERMILRKKKMTWREYAVTVSVGGKVAIYRKYLDIMGRTGAGAAPVAIFAAKALLGWKEEKASDKAKKQSQKESKEKSGDSTLKRIEGALLKAAAENRKEPEKAPDSTQENAGANEGESPAE